MVGNKINIVIHLAYLIFKFPCGVKNHLVPKINIKRVLLLLYKSLPQFLIYSLLFLISAYESYN